MERLVVKPATPRPRLPPPPPPMPARKVLTPPPHAPPKRSYMEEIMDNVLYGFTGGVVVSKR